MYTYTYTYIHTYTHTQQIHARKKKYIDLSHISVVGTSVCWCVYIGVCV
jgi:hypothetical protein